MCSALLLGSNWREQRYESVKWMTRFSEGAGTTRRSALQAEGNDASSLRWCKAINIEFELMQALCLYLGHGDSRRVENWLKLLIERSESIIQSVQRI